MGQEDQEKLDAALISVLGWTKKLNCWLDANRKVVAYHPFKPDSWLPDSHVVLQAIRNSGRWCCIKLFSDYNYVWEMSLTPSGWNKESRKFKDPDEHKEAVFAQADTFEELIVRCLFAIQKYDASNVKP